MKFLSVTLPQDVQRELYLGKIDTALKLIDEKLKKDLPGLLHSRLLYEKERIRRLLLDYPFSMEDARKEARNVIKDFTDSEFDKLFESGILDYIIVNGEPRFEERFAFNIGFALKEYSKRIKIEKSVLESKNFLKKRLNALTGGEEPKTYKIRARITITPKYGKFSGKLLKVWLPVAKKGFQIKDVNLISTSHNNYEIFDNDGQKTIYFEDRVSKNNKFYVEFEYTVSDWINHIDPNKVEKGFDESLRYFTEQKLPQIIFTPYLINLTNEIIGQERNPYLKAKLIYDWITLNVNYSYVRPYGIYENIPEFTATNLKGDCGFQALLFITMCRIAGIPARWQSGWYIDKYFASPHDWALFYVKPYGWIPADLSFGGARRDTPSYRNFYFGNLDAHRMVANIDFMSEFKNKKYYRTDPYDNQTGELETEKENLYYDKHDYKIEIIKFEET